MEYDMTAQGILDALQKTERPPWFTRAGKIPCVIVALLTSFMIN
jgi:hypothetical protein